MHFSDRSVLFASPPFIRTEQQCCAELYFGVIGNAADVAGRGPSVLLGLQLRNRRRSAHLTPSASHHPQAAA